MTGPQAATCRSLSAVLDFVPLLLLGPSVRISFALSSTMLQCLSDAVTWPRSCFLRLWVRMWVLFSTCPGARDGEPASLPLTLPAAPPGHLAQAGQEARGGLHSQVRLVSFMWLLPLKGVLCRFKWSFSSWQPSKTVLSSILGDGVGDAEEQTTS